VEEEQEEEEKYVGNWQPHYVGKWVTNRGFGRQQGDLITI